MNFEMLRRSEWRHVRQTLFVHHATLLVGLAHVTRFVDHRLHGYSVGSLHASCLKWIVLIQRAVVYWRSLPIKEHRLIRRQRPPVRAWASNLILALKPFVRFNWIWFRKSLARQRCWPSVNLGKIGPDTLFKGVIQFLTYFPCLWGTRWRIWLRYCATSRKVAGSIPDGVIWIFHWHNLSGRTMALGLTQPLTEMSTRNISWG